jgi:hypothetical protein
VKLAEPKVKPTGNNLSHIGKNKKKLFKSTGNKTQKLWFKKYIGLSL